MNDIDINQTLSKLQEIAATAQGQVALIPYESNSSEFNTMLKSAIENVYDVQQQAGKLSDSFEKGEPQTNLT